MSTSPGLRSATAALRITEIFLSLQGESTSIGCPTVFVRTTGCPLRCTWCDTAYAFSGGTVMSVEAIVDQVAGHGVSHVTVTGGEPLAQPGSLELMSQLCDQGYRVSLETSGALDISAVDRRVIKVVDMKPPGSGEESKNLLSNLDHLAAQDELKFVIADRQDYDWSCAFIAARELNCEILFSPSFSQLPAVELADWIVADKLAVRFQMQLHKLLWNDEPGR